ncbi:MFS transporter [Oceanobacillus zhaokaii]|uniref:MFS transporter n=1 Tax=Oceanobacillus zhaokaii TaxID=2052660 RepID=A0A345PCN1_9BACI|nr:sugar porter family MFS transporter [Oceanobacillus zhaokaii]AXI07761.1 MFS transporter [Oceanobacillus zhaokaii]
MKSRRWILLFGALGGLLYGVDQGVISGVLLFIENDIPLTSLMEGVVVSSLLLGAIIGSAGSGWLSDRIGRRKTIAIISILFIIGSIGSAVAPDALTLIIARIINGLGVGGSMAIIPVYLAELAPTPMRGKVTALYQLMLTTGILISYLSNHLLAPFEAWRWMLAVSTIPGVLMLGGIIFMPESPRWLLRQNQEIKAREVLGLLRKPNEIDNEVKAVKQIDRENNESVITILKSKWMRSTLIIGILIGVFQQIVGINAVIYYAPTIFTEAGMENTASTLGTMGIGLVNVLMTVAAIMTVDKLGRKKLLKIGSVAMSASLIVLSLILFTSGLNASTVWLTVIFLGIYVMSFAVSWGAVTWVIIPELFPLKARGAGMGIAIMGMSAANLIVTLVFPMLLDSIGIAWMFTIFATIAAMSFIFVSFFVPETKGRSLEDIEKDLRKSRIS